MHIIEFKTIQTHQHLPQPHTTNSAPHHSLTPTPPSVITNKLIHLQNDESKHLDISTSNQRANPILIAADHIDGDDYIVI